MSKHHFPRSVTFSALLLTSACSFPTPVSDKAVSAQTEATTEMVLPKINEFTQAVAKTKAQKILKDFGEVKEIKCGPHMVTVIFTNGKRLISGRDFTDRGPLDYLTLSSPQQQAWVVTYRAETAEGSTKWVTQVDLDPKKKDPAAIKARLALRQSAMNLLDDLGLRLRMNKAPTEPGQCPAPVATLSPR